MDNENNLEDKIIEKEIYKNTNEILVLQICEILKENNIPFIRKDDGVGDYLNKVWGNNIGTKRIYVNSKEYEKAKELLDIFNKSIEENDEGIPEELKESEESTLENMKEINKYNKMKKILFVWLPLIMVLILIICLIVACGI